jgi:hypothetical protein
MNGKQYTYVQEEELYSLMHHVVTEGKKSMLEVHTELELLVCSQHVAV